MWFQPRSTAHDGTPPAAAMPTPFNFPCGEDFLQYQQNEEQRAKCAPPNFEAYWWSSAGYYSPAICPQGYTAGCFRWNSGQGPPVEATETAVQCVPEGYACVTNDISNAFSYSASAPMIQVRWAHTDLPGFATHPLYPGVNPTDNNLLGEGVAPTTAGNNLAARQVSSGFAPGLPESTMTSIVIITTTREPQPSRTGEGGGSNDDDDRPNFPQFKVPGSGGGGLSTGAKAGIAVAVTVAVLILVGIIVFFWRRYRRNKTPAFQGQDPSVDPSTNTWAQPQMTSQGDRYELPGAGGAAVAMPPSAHAHNEKPEMSSEPSYRGSQGYPAELHAQTYNPQSPHGQHSELPGVSTTSPDQKRSELPGTTEAYTQSIEMDQSQQQVQAPSPTYHDPSPGLQAPVVAPSLSPPPPAAVQYQAPVEPSADELMQQQARLEERRQRLLELERIDREQEELQQRIRAQGRS